MKATLKNQEQYHPEDEKADVPDCRHKCLKRYNFNTFLPDNIKNDPFLSIRLVTVVICRNCGMRTFCLPNYSITKIFIKKYMSIWRNRDIWAKITYNDAIENENVKIIKNKVN